MPVLRDNGRGRGWPKRRSLWWKTIMVLSFVFPFFVSCKGLSGAEPRKHRSRYKDQTKTADHSNCHVTLPHYNSTLLGGIASGTFTKIGRVENLEMCGTTCCQDETCDVAFTVDDICYNVQCYSYKLCMWKSAGPSKHHTTVMYSQKKDGSLRLAPEKQKKPLSHSRKHFVLRKGQHISNNVSLNMNNILFKSQHRINGSLNLEENHSLNSQNGNYSKNEMEANKFKQQKLSKKIEERVSFGEGRGGADENTAGNKTDIQNGLTVGGITIASKANNTNLHSGMLIKNKSNKTKHITAIESLKQHNPSPNITSDMLRKNSKDILTNNSLVNKNLMFVVHSYSSSANLEKVATKSSANKSSHGKKLDNVWAKSQNHTVVSKASTTKSNRTVDAINPNQTLEKSHSTKLVQISNSTTGNTSTWANFNETHFWKDNAKLRKTSLLAVAVNESSSSLTSSEQDVKISTNNTLKLPLREDDVGKDNTVSLSSVDSLLENRNGDSSSAGGLIGVRFDSNDSSCLAKRILHNVTLRNGLHAGEFTNYGKVKDVETCIRLCCEEKACDLSLMLRKKCYTLHCHSNTSCRLIPAHSSKLDPVLAFVSRSSTDKTKTKPKTLLRNSKITLQSVQKFLRDPKCHYKDVKHGVTLRHGLMAGEFKTRGVISDMKICIGLCCSDPTCNAAFIAGEYCYSVACYSKTLCTPVKAHASDHITSKLALMDRGGYLDEESDKRQSIPGVKEGLISPAKKYTVIFNVTSAVFTTPLQDFESLEFLNFAEKLQIGVSTLYTTAQLTGFKKCEVISFRPSPLIVNMTLTFEGGTNVKDILRTFLIAINKRKLISSIDGNVETYKLDPLGFQFITTNKSELVCQAGHDYDVTWDITIFGEVDHQVCPRGATGKVKRKCIGSLISNTTWDIPDFSGCVSSEYKTLHTKSKQFADGAKEKILLSELKVKTGTSPMEILKRLQKLALQDTFREEILKAKQQALEVGRRKSKVGHSKSVVTKTANKIKTSISKLNNTVSGGNHNINKVIKTSPLLKKKPHEDVKGIDYHINSRHHIPKPNDENLNVSVSGHIATDQRFIPNFGKLFHHVGSKQYGRTEHHISEVARPQSSANKKLDLSTPWSAKHTIASSKENIQKPDQTNSPEVYSTRQRMPARAYGKHMGPWSGGLRTQLKYPHGANFRGPQGALEGPIVRNGFRGAMINLHTPQRTSDGTLQTRQYMNGVLQKSYGALKPNNPYIAQLHSPPRPSSLQNGYNSVWQNNVQGMGPSLYGKQQLNNNYGTLFSPPRPPSVYGNGPFGVGRKRRRRYERMFDSSESDKSLIRVKRYLDYDSKGQNVASAATVGGDDDELIKNVEKYTDTHNSESSTLLNRIRRKAKQKMSDSRYTSKRTTGPTNKFSNYSKTSSAISGKRSHSNLHSNSMPQREEMYASFVHSLNSAKGKASPSGSQQLNDITFPRKKRQNVMWYNSRVIPSVKNSRINPFTQLRNSVAGPQQTTPFLTHVRTSYNNEADANSRLTGAGTYDITYSQPPSQGGNVPLGVIRPPFRVPQQGNPDRHLNSEPFKNGYKGSIAATFKPPFSKTVKSPGQLGILQTTPSGPLNSEETIPATLTPNPVIEHNISKNKSRQDKDKNILKQKNTSNLHLQKHRNEKKPHIKVDLNQNSNTTLNENQLSQNITEGSSLENMNFGSKQHHAALHSGGNVTLDNVNTIANGHLDTSISSLKKMLTAMTENHGMKSSLPLNTTSYLGMNGVNAFGQLATAPSPFAPVIPKAYGPMHLAPMFGGDLLLAADILRFLSTYNELAKPVMTIGEFTNFLNSASHLMDMNNQHEWHNAEKHIERLRTKGMNVLEDANAWDWDHSQMLDAILQQSVESKTTGSTVILELVQSVESYATKASFRLEESHLKNPFITRNILMDLKVLDTDNLDPKQPLVFPNYSIPDVAKWSNKTDTLILYPAIFKSSQQVGAKQKIHLISSRYRTVADLITLKNPPSTGSTSPSVSSDETMNSQMITTTALPSPGKKFNPPVRIVLTHIKENVAKLPQQCVFWKNPGKAGQAGKWSGDGCRMAQSNLTHTVCECSHLTSFGLLAKSSKAQAAFTRAVAPTPTPQPSEEGSNILNILIGLLFLLLLILIILILVFFIWRRRKQRQKEASDTVRGGALGPGARPKTKHAQRREANVQQSPTTSPRDGDTVDKSDFEAMMAARRKAIQDRGDKKPQKTDSLLMKEKAIIYSEYRQPYNFMAHERPSPTPRTKRRQEARLPAEAAGGESGELSRDGSDPSSARPQPKPRRPRRMDQ